MVKIPKFPIPRIRKYPSSNNDKYLASLESTSNASGLFISIFMLGIFIIFLLNISTDRSTIDGSTELRGWKILLQCGLLLLIMLIYAILTAFVSTFKLERGQAGDNCYYLGFLFTLVSLVFALYDFVEGGGGENRLPIVQDFGIALVTTIAGLLLRVLFNQTRLNPDYIEEIARTELVKKYKEMTTQLESIVIEFNNFSRIIQQSISDLAIEQTKATNKLLNDSLRSELELGTQSISKANLDFVNSINSLKTVIVDEFTNTINNASSEFIDSLKSSLELGTQSINKANSDFVESTNSLKTTIVEDFTQITEELINKTQKVGENLTENISATKRASDTISSLAEQVKLNAAGLEEHRKTTEQVSTIITKFSEQLSFLNEQLNAVSSSLDGEKIETLKAFTDEINQLVSLLEENRGRWGEVESSVASIVDDLRKLEPLLREFPANFEEINKLFEDLKPKRAKIKSIMEKFVRSKQHKSG